MKEVNAPNCGREDSLIAFLYGELSEAESQLFRSHLQSCHACSDELAQFQDVRESVVAWRNESIGVLSPSLAQSGLSAETVVKPSALSALRQFFTLSPLWMKGSVAFASILFCLLAGLAIARLRETPAPVIVVSNSVTQEQVDAQVQQRVQAEVERRVKEELERFKNSAEPKQPAIATVKKVTRNSGRQSYATVAGNSPLQKARRPLSKTEREQLAADLRLVSARNEGEFDLLDDGINQ